MKYIMNIKTAKQNEENRLIVVENWLLGPDKTSINQKDNKPYWSKLASVLMVEEAEARRMLCANCEYYNNTDYMMEQMESIPLDKFDLDGGGRGYCHKFDFICHNLRTCQAWESKEFELDSPTKNIKIDYFRSFKDNK